MLSQWAHWMDASPTHPSASRSPPLVKPTSSSATLAPAVPHPEDLSSYSLFSSAAVKVGREVWCLRELREHSCLFQTGHPTPSNPPPLRPPQSIPGLTKGTFIHRGPGNLCGFYSYAHIEKMCVESLLVANSKWVTSYVGIQTHKKY